MDSMFYVQKGDIIECCLCPNFCKLQDQRYGLCKARKRSGNKIENPYSGIISSSGIDPIEKKPLYHFKPGSGIFSVGFYGCTLHCQFCQNYSISQYTPELPMDKINPDDIIKYLKNKNLTSIAFTYSEPTLHFEWILETAKLCRENNIDTVLVTNGYLNPEPAEMLLEHIDAANIDLKSANDLFYKDICKGKIIPVKEFIKIAYARKVHIEVTTLVITDTNDDIIECREIADFISEISKDIPFHISRYHPEYNFDKNMTPLTVINEWIQTAREKLNFVYDGNTNQDGYTNCKKCNRLLVTRYGYNISIKGLKDDGTCSDCGENNYFIL